MLRTLVFALALVAPGIAVAQQAPQQFPDSAVGIEVRGDDGTVIGRVDHVVRDSNGRIMAAEIAGQEPGSAPYAPADLIAENATGERLFVVDRRSDRRATGGDRSQSR